MKLAPAQVEAFLAKPPATIRGLLIYGPDQGQVREKVHQAIKAIVPDNDPFRISLLTYDAVKEEPALLAEAIAALSFSPGRRCIHLQDMGSLWPKALEECLLTTPGDALVICEAGELPPSAAVRKWFENTEGVVALACYKEEGAALQSLIRDTFRPQGITIAPEALRLLETSIAGDRQYVRNELQKLMLYLGNTKQVEVEDVLACVGEPLDASFDEMCIHLMGENPEAGYTLFKRLLREGNSAIALVRTMIRYVTRLHIVRAALDQGMAEQPALALLKPPLFFKYVPAFKQQLRRWNQAQLFRVLQHLWTLEAECKKTGTPTELLCMRTLWQVGNMTSKAVPA